MTNQSKFLMSKNKQQKRDSKTTAKKQNIRGVINA